MGPVSVKSAKVAGREEIRVLMAVRPPQWNRTTPESSPEIRPFGQAYGMLTSGRGQLSSSRNSGVKSSRAGSYLHGGNAGLRSVETHGYGFGVTPRLNIRPMFLHAGLGYSHPSNDGPQFSISETDWAFIMGAELSLG